MRRLLPTLITAAFVLAGCGGGGADDDPRVIDAVRVEQDATDDEPDGDEAPIEPEADSGDPSPLTGEPLDADVHARPLLLAKIENSPQARPQTGLDAADVVYEEVVEGGVTRFVAIFHSELTETAGPIRSARPVDTQIMTGYGPSVFAYSGARAEVRSMLAQTPSIRVTEGAPGFYRDSSRYAPHNLYLRPADVLEHGVDNGASPIADVGWVFDEEPPPGALTCADLPTAEDCDTLGRSLEIAMTFDYRTGWEYDEDAGRYRRSQNGEPFQVTGPGRIGAANVVVLATRHYVSAGNYPETDVVTDDARAVVLRDGQRYEARWSKPSADADLRLTTLGGEPFPLAPGPTWVHLPKPEALPPAPPTTSETGNTDQAGLS